MYSRLDLFLVDQFYLENVLTSTIESITMSDHAPITLTFCPIQMGHLERTWRLNESLLDKEEIVEELGIKIKEYFEINETGEVSEQAVWEAHKTVVRGELIAYGSYIKKEGKREIKELLEKINVLEVKHKKNFDPVDSRHLESLRAELSQCLERRVKNKIRFFVNRAYEQGNKCGRLLAKQLKKQQDSRHVHSLLVQGKKVVETKAIAAEFGRFYEALYNIPKTDTSIVGDRETDGRKEIWDYIKEVSMPTLSKTIIDEIERPITVEELSRVIATLSLGKSPGPDGLTILYYKTFLPVLVVPLCNYFNSINAANPLPPEALLAYITVLPKGRKTPKFEQTTGLSPYSTRTPNC